METGTVCHDTVIRVDEVGTHELGTNLLLFNFQGPAWSLKRKEPVVWGCSSVGRAPALQAGGHGFESHHLHQSAVPTAITRGDLEETPKFIPDGIVTKVPNKEDGRHTGGKMGRINTRVTVCSSGG